MSHFSENIIDGEIKAFYPKGMGREFDLSVRSKLMARYPIGARPAEFVGYIESIGGGCVPYDLMGFACSYSQSVRYLALYGVFPFGGTLARDTLWFDRIDVFLYVLLKDDALADLLVAHMKNNENPSVQPLS